MFSNMLYFLKNLYYNNNIIKKGYVIHMLNEKDLTKMCEEICNRVGYEFTIPVKINKRLTRTLGRVSWIKNNGIVKSTLMEISYQLLNTATLDSITAVVEHECAHYLVTMETHENHGHDKVFKAMCARIGCTNDGTCYHSLDREVPETQIYKYFVKCENCGSVGKFHRAGKIVQHPELYKCKCGGSLHVIQNF